MAETPPPVPPVAPRKPHTHTEHGVERDDPWYWLGDRDDPDVIPHLEAENAYTEAMLAGLAPLRKRLYDEILGRIQETDLSVPWRKGAWSYYSRTVEGKPYAIHCRRPAAGGDEQILLDENARAEGHEHYRLGRLAISPDHRRIAFAEDTDGSELYEIRVVDLDTGATHDHVITGAKSSVVWANDGRTLFYTVPDPTDRPYRVLRHDVEEPAADDVVVLTEADPMLYLYLGRSRDDRWILAETHSKVTSEVRVLDADDPTAAFRPVLPRVHGVEYEVASHAGGFYVLTNRDAANFRLLAISADGVEREVIAHDPDVYLTGVDAFAGHLVVSERRAGLPTLRVIRLSDGAEHHVAFDEAAYSVGVDRNPEFDTTTLRFAYESMLTPRSIFDYDLDTRERVLLKQVPVLGGYDPSRYETARVFATAPDGKRVPISLVYPRGIVLDGSHPCFVAGYGSYGTLYDPSFRHSWVSLLDRGVVCGIAHIRGGSELGRPWYDDGKLAHKTNTFTDFIAAAEHLIASGYTSPERFAIYGGSAGGLLVGNVLNERPDLFRAALGLVPFVDIVTTILDESLPLTITEWEEWGDPRQREAFDRMLGYSPYDNVRAQHYPDLLITGGLNDPRVGYWEPAKWAQRLRERKTGGTVLLKTYLGAGHAGRSGRYGMLEEVALEYAFVLDRIGATEPITA